MACGKNTQKDAEFEEHIDWLEKYLPLLDAFTARVKPLQFPNISFFYFALDFKSNWIWMSEHGAADGRQGPKPAQVRLDRAWALQYLNLLWL